MMRLAILCQRCNRILRSYETTNTKGMISLVMAPDILDHECFRLVGYPIASLAFTVAASAETSAQEWAEYIDELLTNGDSLAETRVETLRREIQRAQDDVRQTLG